jgi:hypothetical protein
VHSICKIELICGGELKELAYHAVDRGHNHRSQADADRDRQCDVFLSLDSLATLGVGKPVLGDVRWFEGVHQRSLWLWRFVVAPECDVLQSSARCVGDRGDLNSAPLGHVIDEVSIEIYVDGFWHFEVSAPVSNDSTDKLMLDVKLNSVCNCVSANGLK